MRVSHVDARSTMRQLTCTGQSPAAVGVSVRVLSTAVQDLCLGQALDVAFEERVDVTVAECTAMAEAKTGALFGAACELGALAGGADARRARCYRMFGRRLGLAFQLADDLLGIWGDPEVTGKPAGCDLVSRKKSLPVVAALTSGTEAGNQLALVYRQGDNLDAARAAEAAATSAELIRARLPAPPCARQANTDAFRATLRPRRPFRFALPATARQYRHFIICRE